MIDVLPPTDTLDAAVPPMETVAPDANPVPVIVIDVPPTVGPEGGDTVLTVGGVGVGVGEGAAAHGSTLPIGDHPLDQRYHCESVPNA